MNVPFKAPVPSGTPLKVDRMLAMAQEFYEAAARCGKIMESTRGSEWLPHPQVVNYAFAAELGLKGLQVRYHGKPSRRHELDELFGSLPPDVQARICNGSIPVPLMQERLADIAKAFEIWRYAYEHGQISISINLVESIARSAIAVLQKDVGSA